MESTPVTVIQDLCKKKRGRDGEYYVEVRCPNGTQFLFNLYWDHVKGSFIARPVMFDQTHTLWTVRIHVDDPTLRFLKNHFRVHYRIRNLQHVNERRVRSPLETRFRVPAS
jgi:hypothetical protein